MENNIGITIRFHFYADVSVDVAIAVHGQETESRVCEAVPVRRRRRDHAARPAEPCVRLSRTHLYHIDFHRKGSVTPTRKRLGQIPLVIGRNLASRATASNVNCYLDLT